ncbi:MAG: PRC-barrel domain-containing protein [Acidobacteriota bacterium]
MPVGTAKSRQRCRQKPEAGRGGSEYITAIERASKLIGRDVKNRQGEELGEIENLYIDPDQDRVCFAVLSHGGVLGARDKLFAIPWQAFEMTGDEDTLILDISKDRLKTAPNASKAERDTWDNPDLVVTVYEFYRIDPYWKGEFGTRGGHPK